VVTRVQALAVGGNSLQRIPSTRGDLLAAAAPPGGAGWGNNLGYPTHYSAQAGSSSSYTYKHKLFETVDDVPLLPPSRRGPPSEGAASLTQHRRTETLPCRERRPRRDAACRVAVRPSVHLRSATSRAAGYPHLARDELAAMGVRHDGRSTWTAAPAKAARARSRTGLGASRSPHTLASCRARRGSPRLRDVAHSLGIMARVPPSGLASAEARDAAHPRIRPETRNPPACPPSGLAI